MTEKPFVHKKAFCDFTTNFIFHENVIKILFKLIFPNKRELNILNLKSIKKYLKIKKPKYLIHLAGINISC